MIVGKWMQRHYYYYYCLVYTIVQIWDTIQMVSGSIKCK